MKTCRQVVYEKKQYTCYKTVYERFARTRRSTASSTSPKLATENASTRYASRSTRPRTYVHLHGVQAGLGNQDQGHLLHGVQAGLGNQDQGHLLHGVQAGLGNQDQGDLLHGVQAGLGNQDQGHLLHGVQAGLGNQDQGNLLHGVQAGLGDQDQENHYTVCKPVWETKTKEICYTVCKPVWETKTRTSTTRFASRSGKPRPSDIHYTVCKPVWETKTRDISTRCASRSGKPRPRRSTTRYASRSGKPGPRTSATRCASRSGKPRPRTSATRCASRSRKPRRNGTLCDVHGMQAGLGNQDARTSATRCASRSGKPRPRRFATRLQARLRDVRAGSVLHDLQAGPLHQDDQGVLRPLGNASHRVPRPGRQEVRAGTRLLDLGSLQLPLHLRPGECKVVKSPVPARKVCKKVWVPETKEKTINCVRYERQVCKKMVPYKVCRHGQRTTPDGLHVQGLPHGS